MDSFMHPASRSHRRTRAILASAMFLAVGFCITSARGQSQPSSAPISPQPAASPPIATPPAAETLTPTPPPATPSTGAGWLRVTGTNVNVRAQPDTNSLAVTRVAKDTVLQSLGLEHGWYAIKPPPDVFSIVAIRTPHDKEDRIVTTIERQGNQGIVRVEEGTTLRVRAGSRLTNVDPKESWVQAKLPNGARVQILEEQGDWLKIAPPDEVKVYISAEFVQPISDAEAAALRAGGSTALAPSATAPGGEAARISAPPPGGWAAAFKAVDAKIETEAQKPQPEQSWSALAAELKPISEQRDDVFTAGNATRRLEDLEQRANQETLRAGSALVKKDGTEVVTAVDKTANPAPPTAAADSTPATESPSAATAKQENSTVYDAEGELQISTAVPVGEFGLRYRLLDPITRKARAYVEFPWYLNFSATTNLGRYIGIRGQKTVDMQKDVSIWRAASVTVLSPDRSGAQPRTNP